MEKSHNAEKKSAYVALRIHRFLAVYVGVHGALFMAFSFWGLAMLFFPETQIRVDFMQVMYVGLAGTYMVLTPFQAFRDPENAGKTPLILGSVISLFLDGAWLAMLF